MRYEAFAYRGFQEKGVTDVIVTRTDDAGWLQVGVFLVDLHCLGVKDAFFTEMPAIDWPQELNKMIAPGERRAATNGSGASARSRGSNARIAPIAGFSRSLTRSSAGTCPAAIRRVSRAA